MLNSIRLITFDAMKTLITPASDIGTEYLKVAKIYGVNMAKDDHILIDQLNASFVRNLARMSEKFPNYGLEAGLKPLKWWSILVMDTFIDAGFDKESDYKKLQNTGIHLYRHYSRGNCFKLEDGVYETLNRLKNQQPEITLAVLSNFDDRLETILRDLGVRHFFQYLFLSSEIGYAKPDLRIFEHALKIAQVKPEKFLHVGDDIERDYCPVIELGGQALLINKKVTKDKEDYTLANDKQVVFIRKISEMLYL